MQSHYAPTRLKATIALAIVSLLLLTLISFGQSSQGPRNGTTSINSAIAGSTSTWSNTGNALTVDGTFGNNTTDLTITDEYTDYLVITNFGFSIPATGAIAGIQVRVTRLETNSKVLDYRLRLVKGGTVGSTDRISGVAWPATNTTRVYGTSSDMWGDTWTDADINSTTFGVALAVKRVAGGVAPINAQVDNIRITVFYNVSLPVELLSYTAACANNRVTLNWQTATELNNDYFTIERSTDGINYNAIESVDGSGNTSVVQSYSFADDVTNPSSTDATLYYRLHQTDFDGTTKEIGVRTVTVNRTSSMFSVYPNPFVNSINVCLENIAVPAVITVRNVRGKTIYSETITAISEAIEHTINLPEKTEPGVYFISVTNEKQNMVKPILK